MARGKNKTNKKNRLKAEAEYDLLKHEDVMNESPITQKFLQCMRNKEKNERCGEIWRRSHF